MRVDFRHDELSSNLKPRICCRRLEKEQTKQNREQMIEVSTCSALCYLNDARCYSSRGGLPQRTLMGSGDRRGGVPGRAGALIWGLTVKRHQKVGGIISVLSGPTSRCGIVIRRISSFVIISFYETIIQMVSQKQGERRTYCDTNANKTRREAHHSKTCT